MRDDSAVVFYLSTKRVHGHTKDIQFISGSYEFLAVGDDRFKGTFCLEIQHDIIIFVIGSFHVWMTDTFSCLLYVPPIPHYGNYPVFEFFLFSSIEYKLRLLSARVTVTVLVPELNIRQ